MKNGTKRTALKIHAFIPLVPPSTSEALVKTYSVSSTVMEYDSVPGELSR